VERYRERMEQIADAEIDSWPLGEEISMLTRMQAIARTVIMETIFGGTETEDLRTLDTKVENLLAYARKPQNMELVHIAARREKGFPKGFLRVRDELSEAIYTVLARLRSEPEAEERDDVMSMLLRARREDGTALSDQELRDQLVTLLIQGHSSTATGMAWTLERVVRHPQVMERLREEAQSDGREYLNAVLKESLRVRPPLANTSMRKVARPYRLGDYELPEGTLLTVAIYLIHRNPSVYEDPTAFRPERFLDWKPGRYDWIPFGEGHRHCIGSTFALTQMETVIGAVMRRTRLEPAEQADEKVKRLGIGFSPKGGARAIVTERTPSGAPSQLPA
jgi:cytochrome P450